MELGLPWDLNHPPVVTEDLYQKAFNCSPIKQVDQVVTPLLLLLGGKSKTNKNKNKHKNKYMYIYIFIHFLLYIYIQIFIYKLSNIFYLFIYLFIYFSK